MLVRRLYGVMLCDVQSSKHAKPRRNVAREENNTSIKVAIKEMLPNSDKGLCPEVKKP